MFFSVGYPAGAGGLLTADLFSENSGKGKRESEPRRRLDDKSRRPLAFDLEWVLMWHRSQDREASSREND